MSTLVLINDRGETVPYPPEGLTIRELFTSFADCRLAFLTEAISEDKSAESAVLPTPQTEELNGLIEEPAVQSYTLIQKASYGSQITTFAAKLTAGSATVKLLVDSQPLGTFALTTTENTFSIYKDLVKDATLVLQVTAASSAANLAFTMGFTR